MYEPKNRHLQKQAYKEYQKALNNGQLVKPNCCSQCGGRDVNINGHHDDYAYPLDVVWLCIKCHGEIHGHPYWEHSSQPGRPRIHEDDKARKREWWRKHRSKQAK